MKQLITIVYAALSIMLIGCGQDSAQKPEDKTKGGLGSAISGVFGQSENEKALHKAQVDKIESLKQKQIELQKARTEAVLSTRKKGEAVPP